MSKSDFFVVITIVLMIITLFSETNRKYILYKFSLLERLIVLLFFILLHVLVWSDRFIWWNDTLFDIQYLYNHYPSLRHAISIMPIDYYPTPSTYAYIVFIAILCFVCIDVVHGKYAKKYHDKIIEEFHCFIQAGKTWDLLLLIKKGIYDDTLNYLKEKQKNEMERKRKTRIRNIKELRKLRLEKYKYESEIKNCKAIFYELKNKGKILKEKICFFERKKQNNTNYGVHKKRDDLESKLKMFIRKIGYFISDKAKSICFFAVKKATSISAVANIRYLKLRLMFIIKKMWKISTMRSMRRKWLKNQETSLETLKNFDLSNIYVDQECDKKKRKIREKYSFAYKVFEDFVENELFIEKTVEIQPSFFCKMIPLMTDRKEEDFVQNILRFLFKKKSTLFFKEINEAEKIPFIDGCSIDSNSKILYSFFDDINVAIENSIWRSIGEPTIDELRNEISNSNSYLLREKPDNDDTKSICFSDSKIWIAICFFDILMNCAIKNGVKDNVWISYYENFTDLLLKCMKKENVANNEKTQAYYLIEKMISNLENLTRYAAKQKNEHQKEFMNYCKKNMSTRIKGANVLKPLKRQDLINALQ